MKNAEYNNLKIDAYSNSKPYLSIFGFYESEYFKQNKFP